MDFVNLKVGNVMLRAAVPKTAEGKRLGMMGRRFDSGFNAMLFQFNDISRSFWMKNCIIPLDMIFVLDGVVSSIVPSCPPCVSEPCPSYKGMGQEVIELEGGQAAKLGITVGDSVKVFSG